MKIEDFIREKTEITKSWLQQTLLRSSKSVAALAEAMGFRSDSSLYKAANPMENHRLHLENLPVLIHETGDFAILDEIEAMFGRAAFRLPTADLGLPEINEETRRAIKEFSDYLGEVAGAVQDAKVTRLELEAIERECSQAMAQLAGLLEAVRQLYKNRGKPLKAVAGD